MPDRVHIEQEGDDLGCRIGMDAPVLAVAPAAYRQQCRTATEVDAELFLDGAAQRRPGQRRGETGERRPIFEAVDRKAAVTADLRKVGHERGQLVAAQKLLDDDKIERVAAKRRRAQAIEIEDAQAGLQSISSTD